MNPEILFTIPAVFRRCVASHPDRTAVVSDGDPLSYAALDLVSNRIATELRECGVQRNDAVGVAGKRCPEMIATLLAVAKIGAVLVPLDPAYPTARLQFLATDAGIVRVLDFVPRDEVLQSLGVPCDVISFGLQRNAGVLSAESDTQPEPAPADLAYLTYTSGSTGQPKGVEIPHSAIVHLALNGGVFDWTPPQTLLHMASLSFDLAQFEIWGALLNGATLALLPGPVTHWKTFAATLRRHSVTIANITTALFHQMMEEDPHLLNGVRQILVGGEALSAAHLRTAVHSLPGLRIVNAYGPTESTVIATFYDVPPDFGRDGAPLNDVPIGKPVPGTRIKIVDTNLGSVPAGSTGELLLSGSGLARGYRNRPELTGEKFPVIDGERWYRTGDLVWQSEDGLLHFAGRIDNQLKVRGFRIEAGEVESALTAQPEITRAVVTAHNDRLWAFVIAGGRIDCDRLQNILSESLPAHMIPDIRQVDSFPLTVHGKINTAKLVEQSASHVGQSSASPATSLETKLLAIWSDVLGNRATGLDVPFGEMGGSSMHLARIQHRLEQTLGREIPITELFQFPTIRSLAAHLQSSAVGQHGNSGRTAKRNEALARLRRTPRS